MNRHGETFDDHPVPGEYKVCPLSDCKYKLYVGRADLSMGVTSTTVVLGASIPEVVEEVARRELERQEGLIRDHLKTHQMVDFYRTRADIMNAAYREVAKIMKLADLVFLATATTEGE